jgi:5'-nucleotidase
MSYTLTGKLVVAISSRALFDFEEENRIFESTDDSAYMKLQLERLGEAAQTGVAFPLVKKLLAFNEEGDQRVEVVILSRNDPVSGLRVFRSAEHHGLHLERGVFTRGRPPYHYLRSLHANLFLSANEDDVRATIDAGFLLRACIPNPVKPQNHTRMKSASPLTETQYCSQMKPNKCFRKKGLKLLLITKVKRLIFLCRQAHLNPYWKRFIAYSALLARMVCASEPPW